MIGRLIRAWFSQPGAQRPTTEQDLMAKLKPWTNWWYHAAVRGKPIWAPDA